MALLVDQLSRNPHGRPHDEIQLERLMRQKEPASFGVPAFELCFVRRAVGGEAVSLTVEVLLEIAGFPSMYCGGLHKRPLVCGEHSRAEVQLVASVFPAGGNPSAGESPKSAIGPHFNSGEGLSVRIRDSTDGPPRRVRWAPLLAVPCRAGCARREGGSHALTNPCRRRRVRCVVVRGLVVRAG